MCSPALCETCNKVTWAGCGQHIEEALDGVPEEQLCKCGNQSARNALRSSGVYFSIAQRNVVRAIE